MPSIAFQIDLSAVPDLVESLRMPLHSDHVWLCQLCQCLGQLHRAVVPVVLPCHLHQHHTVCALEDDQEDAMAEAERGAGYALADAVSA